MVALGLAACRFTYKDQLPPYSSVVGGRTGRRKRTQWDDEQEQGQDSQLEREEQGGGEGSHGWTSAMRPLCLSQLVPPLPIGAAYVLCVCVRARTDTHTHTCMNACMHECMHACQRTNTSSRSFTISLALARACSRAPSIARTCWLEPSQSESII